MVKLYNNYKKQTKIRYFCLTGETNKDIAYQHSQFSPKAKSQEDKIGCSSTSPLIRTV